MQESDDIIFSALTSLGIMIYLVNIYMSAVFPSKVLVIFTLSANLWAKLLVWA